MHARTQASNRLAQENRAIHCRKSEVNKSQRDESKGKSKGQSKGTKGTKSSHKGKTSKTGLSSLEKSKSEASSAYH